MRTVVVAALGASLPFEVREAVRDWTAAGLLSESLWVDGADIGPGTVDVDVLVVAAGGPTASGRLQSVLAAAATARVRLVSLQVVGDPGAVVGIAEVQRLQEVMSRVGVGVTRLNVMLRTDTTRRNGSAPLMLSTPNVVVQPADGLASAAPAVALDTTSPVFVAHCAGSLATLAGLWSGQRSAPYDGDQSWVGEQAEMVRWYRRSIDGGAVWAGLRENLVPVDRAPISVDSGGQPLEIAPDAAVPAIVDHAVKSLFDATARLTGEARREPFVPPPRRKVGIGEALREFFAFLATALRNAPARWLRTARDDVSAGLAERATNALYGRSADVEVVVNGQIPRRRLGAAEDISALTQAAGGMASDLSGELSVPPSVREFADAFTYSATALLDGADRSDIRIALPRRGATPLVVADPSVVAPAPDTAAFVVAADLGLPSADAVVTSWSPYSALRVEAQLRGAEEQEVRSGGRNAALLDGIQDARAGLNNWVAAQRSVTWTVLLTLAQRLDGARIELASMLSEARQQPDQDASSSLRAQEQRERVLLRFTFFSLPVILAIVVACFVFTPLLVATVVAVVGVLGWALLMAWRVVAHQRLAWQMIHRQDVARARRAWAEAQVLRATNDVFRLGVAYGCASSWSRVISSVVHRPFGSPASTERRVSPEPLDTPLEMRSATGVFDRQAMAEVVNLVRRQVLSAGWLGEELRRRVADVSERRRREGGWDHAQQTFDDPGLDPVRELQAAAVLVADPVVEQQARRSLETGIEQVVDRLEQVRGNQWALSAIRVQSAVVMGESAADFLEPLLTGAAGQLPDLGFSDDGTMDRAATIDSSVIEESVGTAVSSLPGAAGGTRFDRSVVRLDRGRRTHPSMLGVAVSGAADVLAPPRVASEPRPPRVEPDF